MGPDRTVTLYHSPNTRSTAARILLEELGAPHGLRVLNMKAIMAYIGRVTARPAVAKVTASDAAAHRAAAGISG